MIRSNRDLGNHILIQQGLKPAVGDRLNLGVLFVQALHKQNTEHRNDYVPEINLGFFVH